MAVIISVGSYSSENNIILRRI